MKCRRLILIPFVGLASVWGCQSQGTDLAHHAASQQPEVWDSMNEPALFRQLGAAYEYHLDKLPMDGQAEQAPWAGWYWPTYKDAINQRWQGHLSDSPTAKYAKAFGYDPEALEDAVSLKSGIDSVSTYSKPCEQAAECDASRGETCAMRTNETSGYCVPAWFGQCHAWAPASVVEPEPINPVTINGVTFQPQDIKALMTYVYNNVETDFLGSRCDIDDKDVKLSPNGRSNLRQCRDTNPGAFHVVLANWLGVHKKAFVEDRTWDDEVWNQPIRSYEVVSSTPLTKEEATALIGFSQDGAKTIVEGGELFQGQWTELGPYIVGEGTFSVRLTNQGDADLYVRRGKAPTQQAHDCRPYKDRAAESCVLEGAGEYYVAIHGYAPRTNFELNIEFAGPAGYIFNEKAAAFRKVVTNVNYITESNFYQDGDLNEDLFTVTDRLEYILELNAEGEIVGGEWLTNNPHADFLWVPTAVAGDFHVGRYTFEYAKIKDLLNRSIQAL